MMLLRAVGWRCLAACHALTVDAGQGGGERVALARVEGVSPEIYPEVAEALAEAGDGRFAVGVVGAMVRLAVGAWVIACTRDDLTLLAAIADEFAVGYVLHPPRESWEVAPAPAPAVTAIKVWRADLRKSPVEVDVQFDFDAVRHWPDPARAWGPNAHDVIPFVGRMTLVPAQDQDFAWPWRITHASVDTLDHTLGWTFYSRLESPEEFASRTGSTAKPVQGRRPFRTFRLVSGFAEHDEKLGSSATVDVELAAAPDRYEAERLIWPVIWAVTVEALGEGDWRPSMNWLDVVELLEPLALQP